jgi:hypothetical protein
LRGTPFRTIFCFELLVLTERGKRIKGGLDLKDHITAFAAITAIWPTSWDEFFAVEMHHAIAALA